MEESVDYAENTLDYAEKIACFCAAKIALPPIFGPFQFFFQKIFLVCYAIILSIMRCLIKVIQPLFNSYA